MIRGDARASAEERLAVYSFMYRSRLVEALESQFPRLARLLGAEAFAALTADYVADRPSRHPSLRELGRALPGWLAAQRPDAPALAALAALEWARADVYDLADEPAMTLDAPRAFPPDRFGELPLELIAAHRFVEVDARDRGVVGRARSERGRSAGALSASLEAGPGATLLVWRQEIAVYHRAVDPEERAALALVSAGSRFGVICDALSAAHGDEAAAARAFAWLSTWISDGLLTESDGRMTVSDRARPRAECGQMPYNRQHHGVIRRHRAVGLEWTPRRSASRVAARKGVARRLAACSSFSWRLARPRPAPASCSPPRAGRSLGDAIHDRAAGGGAGRRGRGEATGRHPGDHSVRGAGAHVRGCAPQPAPLPSGLQDPDRARRRAVGQPEQRLVPLVRGQADVARPHRRAGRPHVHARSQDHRDERHVGRGRGGLQRSADGARAAAGRGGGRRRRGGDRAGPSARRCSRRGRRTGFSSAGRCRCRRRGWRSTSRWECTSTTWCGGVPPSRRRSPSRTTGPTSRTRAGRSRRCPRRSRASRPTRPCPGTSPTRPVPPGRRWRRRTPTSSTARSANPT